MLFGQLTRLAIGIALPQTDVQPVQQVDLFRHLNSAGCHRNVELLGIALPLGQGDVNPVAW